VVVFHYEEALYQVYIPLPFIFNTTGVSDIKYCNRIPVPTQLPFSTFQAETGFYVSGACRLLSVI